MAGRVAMLGSLQGDSLKLLGQPRQDRLELAHDSLEQVDPPSQGEIDVSLDRILIGEVDDTDDRVSLADAVDAADPLLDLHRVPRQVEVDHHAARLEVQALGRGVGADQEADRPVFQPLLDVFLAALVPIAALIP
jgi:hypothetical protein